MATTEALEQARRLAWYVGLDQRLAHRLRYDATGHWQQQTLCGKPFWPWFRARATERHCAACRRKGDGDGN